MSDDSKHIGRRVLHFECVESTNEVAREMAADRANDGVVVLADEQTAGRGQLGRTWMCPRGAGILMSVVVFPPAELRRAPILTAWAAVSVCDTIREVTGLHANIKWPNDVLVHGRKVCGILIEQGSGVRGQGSGYALVGIGLNVSQSYESLMAAGLPQATSLSLFSDVQLDRRNIAQVLIGKLDDEYGRLRSGDIGSLEACWKWHVGLLGRLVQVECLTRTCYGRLRNLTFDELELEMEEGTSERLPPETVRHIAVDV